MKTVVCTRLTPPCCRDHAPFLLRQRLFWVRPLLVADDLYAVALCHQCHAALGSTRGAEVSHLLINFAEKSR
jgi:hypothetical protein